MDPVTLSARTLLWAGNSVDWLTQRKAVASEPSLPLHHQTPLASRPSGKTVVTKNRIKKRSVCRI